MAQRWQKAGCWSILMAPLFVFGGALLVGAVVDALHLQTGSGLPAVLKFLFVASVALVSLGAAGFVVWWYSLRGPGRPPPRDAVAPRPGTAAGKPVPGAGIVARGRVGRSRIHVEEWEPAGIVRLRQARSWSVGVLVAAVLVLVGVFVVVPSLENQVLYGGEVRVEAPAPVPLAVGLWAFLGFAWLSLPSLARTVTVDWRRDAVEIVYGRRRRVLGLSRVRGVDLRESVGEISNSDTEIARSTTYTQQVIAWVEPEGCEPVPFLLVETVSASFDGAKEVRRALAPLAEGLAAALGVPFGRPPQATSGQPYP